MYVRPLFWLISHHQQQRGSNQWTADNSPQTTGRPGNGPRKLSRPRSPGARFWCSPGSNPLSSNDVGATGCHRTTEKSRGSQALQTAGGPPQLTQLPAPSIPHLQGNHHHQRHIVHRDKVPYGRTNTPDISLCPGESLISVYMLPVWSTALEATMACTVAVLSKAGRSRQDPGKSPYPLSISISNIQYPISTFPRARNWTWQGCSRPLSTQYTKIPAVVLMATGARLQPTHRISLARIGWRSTFVFLCSRL